MYSYQHHIGDFDRATRHLTRLERSIYRDLLDMYYDTEKQLPLDVAYICRKILARSNEEATAVEQVLNEFFTKTPTGWYQGRCEEEICAYHSSTSQKAIAGRASAAAKALKKQQALNGASTAVEQPLPAVATESNGTSTNQEPITNNHKPLTKVETAQPKGTRLPSHSFLLTEWKDWAVVQRPDLDIEKTFDGFKDFWISKAGKDGVKLDWFATWRNWVRSQRVTAQGATNGKTPNAQEALEAANRAVANRFLMETANA